MYRECCTARQRSCRIPVTPDSLRWIAGTAADTRSIQRGTTLPHHRRESGRRAFTHGRDPRGQSLVEFALVLPMLLVLLLGIADFGRVFQAGIVTETAARNGAETAALERLRNKPPTTPSGLDAYYDNLHVVAASAACREARVLANTTFDAATGNLRIDATHPRMRARRARHDLRTADSRLFLGESRRVSVTSTEARLPWTARLSG